MSVSTSVLVFRLSEQYCAVPLESVQEIILMASLSRPPSMPAIMDGFLNLRGTAVPVVSLSRMFRLPELPYTLYAPIIVLRGANCSVGFLVDQVNQVVSVAAEGSLTVPKKHSFNDCAETELVVTGRVVHVLSPERLFLEKQQQCLSEFQVMEQHRLQDLEVSRL
jgi:purine-binding chemotaxis protein CheW